MKRSVAHMVRENVKALMPYKSARGTFSGDGYIFLDANENPIDNSVNRYPDPYQNNLKAKIAEIKGVKANNIFIGNGSDEIIDLIMRCFCEPKVDSVYTITPSFGMYKVAAGLNAVDIHFHSLNQDFSLDIDGFLEGITSTDKLIFLCTPNNPTGNIIPAKMVEKVCKEFNGMVIVDEAYIDFTEEPSMTSKLEEYVNLIVLQTMSKSWGAAGLRVGLAFANDEVIGFLNKVKFPYNVNVLSQRKALELLDDYESYKENVKFMIEQRKWLNQELEKCSEVVKVHPSDANFVLTLFKDPMKVYNALKDAGIVVRDRSKTHLCTGCLRLSVGLKEENEKMIEIIKAQGE